MFKMTEKEKLAFEIAKRAHKGQVDKAGVNYINHPLNVAKSLSKENERIVALLHDVVEDTEVTLKDLAKFFDDEIVNAVDAITHRLNETYDEYLNRVKLNPLALKVKLKDIENNMDLSRIAHPTEKDYARLKKYQYALKVLNDKNK